MVAELLASCTSGDQKGCLLLMNSIVEKFEKLLRKTLMLSSIL
jgi:hypothetical protein